MKKIISVIVPVYNTGCYLTRCVNSILSQDYNNFEIILVNDGSTDTMTLHLCDKLSEQHECVKVIHKSNGGSASARNMGIINSIGEYIVFIDSDDYIERNMLSSLLLDAEKNNVKLVIGGMTIDGYKRTVHPDELSGSSKLTAETALHYFMLGHWHSACTNLYHRSIFDNLKFPESESNEDYYFNFFAIQKAQLIYVDLNVFYHYVKRSNSNTTTKVSLRNFDWISHTKTIYGIIIENKSLNSLIEEAEYQYLFSNIVLANKALLDLKDGYKDVANILYNTVSNNLKDSKKMLIRNPYLLVKYRIIGILIANFSKLYRWAVINYLKVVRKF